MSLNFTINNKPYTVSVADYPADITLNTFIREHAQLHGTKFMCLEGGCGACVCTIRKINPASREMQVLGVNSCLTLLNICNECEITTIEGIGNRKDGYHPIQKRLANLNGSQCGYCSPGMVMNMYGLLESKRGNITMKEVENSFGGNICRCTGYRPILDAMKSLAKDSKYGYENSFDFGNDIEDLGRFCAKKCFRAPSPKNDYSNLSRMMTCRDGNSWFTPKSIKEIFEVFKIIGNKDYMLVAGNTAHGVYRRSSVLEIFINITEVSELYDYKIDENQIEIGASTTLTETMRILERAKKNSGFEYCQKFLDHIDLIANVPVRNMGSLAGNLSIKHSHLEFPSDIFIMLATVNSELVIATDGKERSTVSILDYLKLDMKNKLIVSVVIPKLTFKNHRINTYKIMPRAQNAHAFVNAGFLVELSDDNKVISAQICFGGINPDFIHATNTEKYLIGKDLFDEDVIKEIMKTLNEELRPDWVLPDASPEYRKLLACGLFYKFLLSSSPDGKVKKEFRSGGDRFKRPLSSGTQVFKTHKDKYPVTQPVPKVEGLIQCSGEAVYMNDFPNQPNQLWAAFVHAKEVNVDIGKIDPSEALKMDGVRGFFSAKDIPGKNSFVSTTLLTFVEDEEIFCSKRIKYYGQPVGIIVADSMVLAEKAAEKVEIFYERGENEKVLATLQDVLEQNALDRIENLVLPQHEEIEIKFTKSKKLRGRLDLGSQYHFTMEPQTTVCIPNENGIEVYSATQWMDLVQVSIAAALQIPENSVSVQVRRLGGGFGAKVSRGSQAACACALACNILNRPVRFVQGLESMMISLGKRFACHSDYEVEIDGNGKVLKLKNTFYMDCGSSKNESPVQVLTLPAFQTCYESAANWKISANLVVTDAPSHTWCRAPGSMEAFAMVETIMEHIARTTNKDPVDIRITNIKKKSKMGDQIRDFINSVEYKKRKNEIKSFNKENRWMKKGLGVSIMQFPLHYFGSFPATVSIYHGDGTVSISHGGIEMGQGINTKITQVAAYTLGLPMDMIKIKASDTMNGANSITTAASMASESVGYAVKKACETLVNRIKPVREQMKNSTWSEVIQKCYERNINLIASGTYKVGDLKAYNIWGICCSEVQVDILTGNLMITRVDLQEDTGKTISPLIDIGQIEGAFIMGVGYWLTEKLVFNRQIGELLTTRTWNYKPPGAKDIPIDFRITLVENNPTNVGFLRSKTTGEPALCLSVSVIFALRSALESARKDAGLTEEWFHLGAPTTPEDIVLASGSTIEEFSLS